ncbi:GMC family oxidoreductase [Steroidobacter sp. S1-65]|uniref:GMC family oxidoreductase n=1 Tax=Steroidobacter gossypii TaxID=2805490 RepID=A0ABS1X042_9GAMM|nr:GMC family oxidoreductase [Steroidobacter gossypii]MBM0106542.1 GMC family oxidoreductase [Steroidobacter gossypii]
MMIDLHSRDSDAPIRCDVAIVGAGMAGLYLASELKLSQASVVVLESGGVGFSEHSQALSRGTGRIVNPDGSSRRFDDYLHESRERYFGGTGNVWGGKCAKLERHDFRQRPWVDYSGWPIGLDELERYYDRACYALNIPTTLDVTSISRELQERPVLTRCEDGDNFTTALRCFSGLTGSAPGDSFAEFKRRVARQHNVSIYLNATVTDIQCSANVQSVSRLHVKTNSGKQCTVEARCFVLAAGGLENPRLLLNSNRQQPNGLGNDCDVVGRFYSGHTVFKNVARGGSEPCFAVMPGCGQSLALYSDKDPTRLQGIFTLASKAQWRERMMGFSVTLERPEPEAADDHYPLFFMTEQAPNPQSRLTLTDDEDALGLRRLHLEWRFDRKDIENLNRGVRLFAGFLEHSKLGRLSDSDLHFDPAATAELSRHHIGATRMHDDPSQGVVDRDCKVHGIDNLYVCGTSVFPTAGLANPTLTVMALAARLGDLLKSQVRTLRAVDWTTDKAILREGCHDDGC